MSNEALMQQLADDASRPDPWPIYERFRETPVVRIDDESFAVSTYAEIAQLLHDPRLSSLSTNLPTPPPGLPAEPPFVFTDPPLHDRMRRVAMRFFGPPVAPGTIVGVEPEIRAVVGRLLDDLAADCDGGGRFDVVDRFSYPLPVTVLCQLFGVPRDDEGEFRDQADRLVAALGAAERQEGGEELTQHRIEAQMALGAYLMKLVARHRAQPNDSMLSKMANDESDDHFTDLQLASSGVFLFLAGHETTVNLIGNGMLTLLRNPDVLERFRREPELAPSVVEELLRFEPPVQYLVSRSALADVEIAGTTIPAGSRVVLLLASGNRDPEHFSEPDRFVPDRPANQHFAFGGGIHYCFGAPLARLETQIALAELVRRLRNPRLVVDPPPYRPSQVLRGPIHLEVEVDGVDP